MLLNTGTYVNREYKFGGSIIILRVIFFYEIVEKRKPRNEHKKQPSQILRFPHFQYLFIEILFAGI